MSAELHLLDHGHHPAEALGVEPGMVQLGHDLPALAHAAQVAPDGEAHLLGVVLEVLGGLDHAFHAVAGARPGEGGGDVTHWQTFHVNAVASDFAYNVHNIICVYCMHHSSGGRNVVFEKLFLNMNHMKRMLILLICQILAKSLDLLAAHFSLQHGALAKK